MINKFLDETLKNYDIPALAIGVYYKDQDFTCAKASTHVKQGPIDADSIFHCASVSKLFTASSIMKLVEEGKLNLYERLIDMLPELYSSGSSKLTSDKRFEEIRLWNMLTHTSGLGDVDDYHWEHMNCDEGALSKYVLSSEEVLDTPMLWGPQTAPEFYGEVTDENGNPTNLFRYSNIAFEILGHIVAKYSGMPYEDFVKVNFFDPLGMNSSTMKTYERGEYNNAEARHEAGMADPFEIDASNSIAPVKWYPYNREHAPSSTLTSNVGDLLKWGKGHLAAKEGCSSVEQCKSTRQQENEKPEHGILQRETYDSIWREYATVPNNGEKMGLGWFMREQAGYKLYGHEGTDDGFRASFWLCPELDLVTVVLANISKAPVKKINKKLFERILSDWVHGI